MLLPLAQHLCLMKILDFLVSILRGKDNPVVKALSYCGSIQIVFPGFLPS